MVSADVVLGDGVVVHHPELVNLYGCEIGDRSQIGPFVEIQRGVRVGADCKISSHSFLCTGVEIQDGVFIGHGVMFINDLHPRAVSETGELQTEDSWQLVETVVEAGASVGSGATVLGGVTIGRGAMVGAGAVVTHDVRPLTTVAGVPARVIQGVNDPSS